MTSSNCYQNSACDSKGFQRNPPILYTTMKVSSLKAPV